MNITVRLHGTGTFVCRPDTTWERESRDFFFPDFVDSMWYAPVVFARISRAGKCIGRKFAGRYYDGANFGILLYPGNLLNTGKPESVASASVLDHSSILPFPLYLPDVMDAGGSGFMFRKGDEVLFSTDGSIRFTELIEDSLSEASACVSQRIGDIVAVELAGPAELMSADEKKAGISAEFCGNQLFDLSLIR